MAHPLSIAPTYWLTLSVHRPVHPVPSDVNNRLPLFLVSLIPNPFFDVIGVTDGALRYPIWGFLAVVGVGKLLKFLVFAYACAFSIQWIINISRV